MKRGKVGISSRWVTACAVRSLLACLASATLFSCGKGTGDHGSGSDPSLGKGAEQTTNSPPDEFSNCSNEFDCSDLPPCVDCECDCPGLYQAWVLDEAMARHTRHPNGHYLLLAATPWVVALDRAGNRRDDPGEFDLKSFFASEAASAGSDEEGNLLLVSQVSPTGESDLHFERISPEGEVLFADTIDVTGDDALLGAATLSDGRFIVVGRGFIGEFRKDNTWELLAQHEALKGVSVRITDTHILVQNSSAGASYFTLDGRLLASRTPPNADDRYCSIGLGLNGHAYEVCTDVSTGDISYEVALLDGGLNRRWSLSDSLGYARAASVSVVGVAEGLVIAVNAGVNHLGRFTHLGEKIAGVPGMTGGLAFEATPYQFLYLGKNSAQMWVAPPLKVIQRVPGESCSTHGECDSGQCCFKEESLGSCSGSEGCSTNSICEDSDGCIGQCDTDVSPIFSGRCRDTCVDEEGCADDERCIELSCTGDDCEPVCLRDCLTTGADGCDGTGSDACVEVESTSGLEAFVCAIPCAQKECGQDGATYCGTCPSGSICEEQSCKEVCNPGQCGIVDGVQCGVCGGGEFCENGACRKLCLDMECGMDNGVTCGICSDDDSVCENGICR